jgi:tetratricopeptide (TPR) repeat protein
MQQYRVNYSLLIGLIIGTLVFSGAVYGLWKYQIERKSTFLVNEAKRLKESGDVRKAAEFYNQYLSIHKEDVPTKIEFAKTELDLTESDDVTMAETSDAVRVLETMLRNPEFVADPGSKEVRKRLIKLYGKGTGTSAQALDHLNLLLESEPDNAELQSERAMYLARAGNIDEAIKYSYQLIGYDPQTDKFDAKKPTHDAEVYATLASIVRSKKDNPELAERIADQMVEANPKSAEAYIQRGRLRLQWKNAEGAKADAAMALQLKPDDLDALLFAVDGAAKDENYDKAQEYVDKAKKLYPEEARVYQVAAVLEIQRQTKAPAEEKQAHYDKALAELDEGIKKVSKGNAIQLQLVKAEIQIPAQDVKGARQTIEELQANNRLRSEFIEYFEARILLAEGKWFQASEALNKIRPIMGDFGKEKAMETDFSLALCYERLGRLDMAKAQYEAVLAQDPANEPAKAGVERTDMGANSKSSGGAGGDPLTAKVNEMLKKPKEQQDWAQLDADIKKMAEDRKLDPTTVKLVQAQVMMMREDYDGAAKLLGEAKALSPQNLQVQRMIIGLARVNSKYGPARAMDVLNKTIDQFGDLPALRIDKADILIQLNKGEENRETLKRELASLATGVDKWTTQQKAELWTGLFSRYLSLNMLEEARQYLTLAADNQPNELPLRVLLFTLAQDANDDAGMKDAQDKILQIVGDQNDSAWLFTEARRRLQQVQRGRMGIETLPQIRAIANQANQQRPDWSELQALRAEIELAANNPTLALEYYDRAEQLGRPAAKIVGQHIKVLSAVGRWQDAGKLLDRIPEQARQYLLGPLYPELLFRTKQTDLAIKQAKKATEDDPKNAQNFYWYGQLLARSTQATEMAEPNRKEVMAQAVKAMQQAAEIQPEFADAWFALINYYAMQKDEANAQKTLRDAQLAMSGDKLQIFLARSYEVLHRWFDAETMYREIYETAPDDLSRAQQLANFYTGPIYQRPDREAKATPLINQILKAGADKKIAANDPILLWARRMAAKMLSSTKDYQNMLKAEKLLCSNSQEGNLLIDDKLALAEILAERPEPGSRMKAIKLLEEVDKVQKLGEPAQIKLGDLYYAVGNDWSAYTSRMNEVTSQFKNSAAAREAYARKLIERGDPRSLADAAKHVQKLNELAPNSPSTFELTVRLAGKNKNPQQQQKVRALLLSRMPKLDGVNELDDNQAAGLAMMASLLTELGDLDSAEKIYTELAARNHSAVFELAKFYGLYGDPAKCFAKLNEIYKPAEVNNIVSVALSIAQQRREKIGDKYDADIQRWLDAGLRENPDSITLQFIQAQLLDLQRKYKESADIYRKLVARTDLDDYRKAIFLNNLAFLLALDTSAKTASDDPLKMVQDAANIMGPNSAILDTRAVVLSSQKDFKGAIRDLELSVTDDPTASKYYHKAVAHLGAGENQNAIKAWEKAESLGLDRNALNPMEFEQFEDMKGKIDQLRKRSVTQAEPRAKAG